MKNAGTYPRQPLKLRCSDMPCRGPPPTVTLLCSGRSSCGGCGCSDQVGRGRCSAWPCWLEGAVCLRLQEAQLPVSPPPPFPQSAESGNFEREGQAGLLCPQRLLQPLPPFILMPRKGQVALTSLPEGRRGLRTTCTPVPPPVPPERLALVALHGVAAPPKLASLAGADL